MANPPYLPGPAPPHRGAARAWDAGADGRALLDRICAQAPAHLAPGGVVLVVHSEVCDVGATLAAFAAAGMEADVSSRRRGPLGPLLRARRDTLESRLAPRQRAEEVAVLRGRRLAEHRV